MPGSTVYHIELINIKTQERRNTYIERRFKNFRNWDAVINNHPQGQILSNLELYGKNKIDADSKPAIQFLLPQQEMQALLDEYKKK